METPRSLPEKVRRKLGEINWKKVIPELVVVSIGLARRRYWRSPDPDFLAKGLSAEDVVHECLKKIFENNWTWDPETHPDFVKFMKESVLPSFYAKLVRSKDNTLVEPFRNDPHTPGGTIEPVPASSDLKHAAHISREQRNQEQLLIENEEASDRARQAKAIVDRLLEAAKGDAAMNAILESAMDGLSKPLDISKHTKIPVKDIYNAQKKLRRIHKKICDEIGLPSPTGVSQ